MQKKQTINTLAQLIVIDKLEIGPVLLNRNRLVAPYTVYSGKNVDKNFLIYKYEENVFQINDPGDQNLASMIMAQVAFNYGLFCKEIIFNGLFDQQDKQLIREMIENTSREIYVKKFLEPNLFLDSNAIKLTAQKHEKYTNAVIKFVAAGQMKKASWEYWATDSNRHAILSSGGKDSLLSFGLLKDLGKEVYPVFINESGRHWYTALNSYRYYKKNVANTYRVWTNADRMFNWMLRHLPFIRKDFANIRSDEYPVRLWTVAVFLFGALPILKKQKIGRLIIGDEYDTTLRRVLNGITHYDGLFDQSRFFDNVISRYFMSKGWAVAQFSILRPLSEMLILKILAERYPDLQKNQVSCHAASIVNERVYPCGKCEKCRRIIGMLTALKINPEYCGYNQTQIRHGIDSLSAKGIHQEAEGYQQLMFMLNINPDVKYKEYPEILQVRIDSQKSPIQSLPQDLRKPLLNIFKKYARGVVIKTGNKWNEVDPENIPDMNTLISV